MESVNVGKFKLDECVVSEILVLAGSILMFVRYNKSKIAI